MEQPPQSQYHHYIPRFMLHRFAIAPTAGRKDDNKRYKKTKGNARVNAVDLAKDPPEIVTVPVRRTFGQLDMYKDNSEPEHKDQQRMERKLGDIERAASRIIATVVDAHRATKDGIWLSRPDKDLLRKFLFVMKYRGPIFFRRFNHSTAEEYNSNDRDEFLEYMRVKGFKRPLDVWFDNLLTIIDMPMDPEGRWIVALFDRIYPGDALWLFTNIRSMHLAFVTPSDLSEEFLLTENAFGIHEGPVSYSVNRSTGERTMTAYSEFHVVNIVSPHLAMILRHNSLPEPLEDMDGELREQKREMLAEQAQMHIDPEHATSLLHDLPVAKARNSYTVVVNGRLVLAKGADGKSHASDMFKFLFFRLESSHVQTINTVMLDQAHNISTLIFKSKTALRKALEYYLSWPTQTQGGHSIKTISDRKDDPMLLLFRKLEHLAHSLGSNVKAKYHVDALMDDDDGAPSFDEAIACVLKTAKPTVSEHPLDLSMTVLVEVLVKVKLNIRAVYALDLILEDDARPIYPDLVFEAVQLTNPTHHNQYTKTLRDVELRVWRMGWVALIEQAMQVSGKDMSRDIGRMRGLLAQVGVAPSTSPLLALARRLSAYTSQAGQENFPNQQRNQPRETMDGRKSGRVLGFSKQGLRNAFDDIGRQIQEHDVDSLRSTLSSSERSKLESSARQTKPEGTAHQISHSTRPADKKYVGDILSTREVEMREVRAPSTSDLAQNAVTYVFLFGLLAWFYFNS